MASETPTESQTESPTESQIDALRKEIDKVSPLLKETLDPYLQRYDLLNSHPLTQPLKEKHLPRVKVSQVGGPLDGEAERTTEYESFMRVYFKSIECVLTRKCSNEIFIDAKATDLASSLEMYDSIETLQGTDDLTQVLSSMAKSKDTSLLKTWIEGKVKNINQNQPIADSPLNSLRDDYLYYRKRSDGPLKRMLSFLMVCSGCDILIEYDKDPKWKVMKDKATANMSKQQEEKVEEDERAFSDDLVEDAVQERDLEIEKIETARAEPYANIYPANVPPPPPFNSGLFSGLFQASGSNPPPGPTGKSAGPPPGPPSIDAITERLGPSLASTQPLTKSVTKVSKGIATTAPVSLEDQTRIQVYSVKSHPINLAREVDSLLRTLSQTNFLEMINGNPVGRYGEQHEVFYRYFTLNASGKSYVQYKEGMLALVDKLLWILQKKEKKQHLRVVEQDVLPKIKDILYSIFLSLAITTGIVQEKHPEYDTYSLATIGQLNPVILQGYRERLDTDMRGVLPEILNYIAKSGKDSEPSIGSVPSVPKVEPVAESKDTGPTVSGSTSGPTVSGPKAGPKAGSRAGPKADPKAEQKAIEKRAGPKADPKAEQKAVTRAGPKADPKAEQKAVTRTGPKADLKAEQKAVTRTGPKTEQKAGPKAEQKAIEKRAGPKAEPKTEPKAGSKPTGLNRSSGAANKMNKTRRRKNKNDPDERSTGTLREDGKRRPSLNLPPPL